MDCQSTGHTVVGASEHFRRFRAVLLDHLSDHILYQCECVYMEPCGLPLTIQTWYSAYLPINTQAVGDRFGANYDVYAVLDQNLSLNQTAYEAYSPVYISAALGMTYTVAFALTLAMLVHTALWHGPRMWGVVRNRRIEPLDIHAKLMAGYREVPSWWYGIVFVTLFALSIVCIQVFDTDLPVWGFIVALLLPIIYFLPSAFLYATTAQIMTLNLIAQLVPGFLLPGRPIAVMVCFLQQITYTS